MLNINQLEPAGKGDVLVYLPYYSNKDKQKILPLALSLYNKGRLEGQRRIEGAAGISFVASWFVSKLPSELTRCRVQFESQAELSYEITILNSEFIDYLILHNFCNYSSLCKKNKAKKRKQKIKLNKYK